MASPATDEIVEMLDLPYMPSRWEQCDNDLLNIFISAIPSVLKCEDATNLQKGSYVAGLNEHVGAGARDRLEDIGLYYKSSNLDFPRS